MDQDRKKELFDRLDSTIRELIEISTPEDSVTDHSLVVAEWAVTVGLMEYSQGTRVDDDCVVLANDDVPVWRIKGLLDSGMTKLRAVETHNTFADMHIEFDGDEEE